MFALTILVSADQLDTIKAELTRKLSDVKSSHRCEAIARGLGFRTYATALNAVRSSTPRKIQVRGDLFSAYLAEHGFEVSPQQFYQVATKVALRDVAAQVPNLTVWGIGAGRPQRKDDGSWETFRDMNAKFRQHREELVSDYQVNAFLASLALLKRITPTKTIRQNTGSYWLKHIAENYNCTYPEGDELGPTYVPSGILIATALHLGFKMKTYVDEYGYDALNVCFNMSKPCLDDLDCEIRPDGARAQSRRFRQQMKRYREYPFEPVAQ